jgi:hypothetical protein
MLAQEGNAKVVQRGANGNNLLHDVSARAIVIDHALDACNLSGDACKTPLRIDLEFCGHGIVYVEPNPEGSAGTMSEAHAI